MIKLKKYLNRPTYAVDRPWTLALLNATTIGLILAIFEPFHYRLNNPLAELSQCILDSSNGSIINVI